MTIAHPHRTIALQPVGDDNAGVTRRAALQVMAASLALAGGACSREPVERIYPYVHMPEAGRGGLPAYYASAFVRDGCATGVLVGTREGRPIKIEGNPSHPSSMGATDAFAQASILELWDPDRSSSVLQRLPRLDATDGEPGSAPSTWAAFDEAWRQRAEALAARQGHGLAILTPSFTSPSLGVQLRALLDRFPRARWHRHTPLARTSARAGARLAVGRECDWVHHFDRARFVWTLDADPFSDGPGRLRHARDWATRRAGTGTGEAARVASAPRSLAIETRPGLFGARADERIAMAPAQIEAVLDRVASRLMTGANQVAPADAVDPASSLVRRIVAALRDAGSGSLVIAGTHLSPRAHAQVAAIHARLDAIGRTVDAIEPLDRIAGTEPEDLASLVKAIMGGTVDTVMIVSSNPAYDAPGSLDVALALRRVPFVAHLGLHRDETARLATWHLPASHDYESWGDALGHDGSATVIQPAILPLYDTRSSLEWLAGLAGSSVRDGNALVRATWRGRRASSRAPSPAASESSARTVTGETEFEAWWRRVLGAGVVEGSAAVPLSLATAPTPQMPPSHASITGVPANGVVAIFMADPGADADGRFANNGWMQELPRPFLALTWDNAMLVGPTTAARLGIATGDVVRVAAGARSIEAAAWVLAEHAEGTVTLPLGQGRRAAGRVGNGVGFDAHVLRRTDDSPVAVTLERTGRRHRFATTQHRLDQEGRELARSVVASATLPPAAPEVSLYAPGEPGAHAWAMTIDLDACIGCNACTIACQAENNIPVVGAEEVARGREMHWIRVDRYTGEGAESGSIFQPVPCMHCEDAPCEVVCPVGATVHDSEGLNVQVYNRCVGTRFCSNNCPYKVRRFNFLKYDDDQTETLKAMRNPDVTVRQRGVMEKCTYCVQRLSRARLGAEKAGVPMADGDVVTACQSACPTHAIHFGDLRDARSDVVRSKTSPRHYAMLDELNTRPRTTYLARVLAAHPGGSDKETS